MLLLAENLKIHESASIAFDRSNAKWTKPKPLYKQKRGLDGNIRQVLSFLLGDIFAMRMRYNRTSFGCDIPRSHSVRYDINPFTPDGAYRLPKANIAPERHITNPQGIYIACVIVR